MSFFVTQPAGIVTPDPATGHMATSISFQSQVISEPVLLDVHPFAEVPSEPPPGGGGGPPGPPPGGGGGPPGPGGGVGPGRKFVKNMFILSFCLFFN